MSKADAQRDVKEYWAPHKYTVLRRAFRTADGEFVADCDGGHVVMFMGDDRSDAEVWMIADRQEEKMSKADEMERAALRTLEARKRPMLDGFGHVKLDVPSYVVPPQAGGLVIHVVEPQDVLDLVDELRDERVKVNSLEEENSRVKQACDIFEKNSADACDLESLLRRIREWDAISTQADGPYWKAEIDRLVSE